MELVDRIAKVARQKYADGNSVRDNYKILTLVGIKRTPKAIEKGRNSIKDICSALAVGKTIIKSPKRMPVPLGLQNLLRILQIAKVLCMGKHSWVSLALDKKTFMQNPMITHLFSYTRVFGPCYAHIQ